ncbi:MAG: DUF2442 domain-containing protein [Bacteroidales bacterium]|nr:DUF2442 domain-containing protein [Bacteroidales bacterium]
MQFLEITKAEYMDNYRLRLYFNTGEVRIADLESSLVGEVFVPLRDTEMFKRFTVKFATVTWENDADFAPEYLYDISIAA